MRRAITDLKNTHTDYPGDEFLKRLDTFKDLDSLQKTITKSQEVDLKRCQEYIQFRREALLANSLIDFEEVVLANPAPPTKGVERPDDAPDVALPTTVEELDGVWKEYLVKLRRLPSRMKTAEGRRLGKERAAFMEDFFRLLTTEERGTR